MCSGTAPEALLGPTTGLWCEHAFTCDVSNSSYQLIADNHGPDIIKHHFLDVKDLVEGRCKCAFHALQDCSLDGAPEIDIFLGGMSCCPYSTSRSKRRKGTEAHADSQLGQISQKLVQKLQPGIAIMENVMGMMTRDSHGTSVSPLEKSMQQAKTTMPQYTGKVFRLDSKHFLMLHRRHFYVVYCHERVGGAKALEHISRPILDRSAVCLHVSKLHAHQWCDLILVTRGSDSKECSFQ